MSHEYDALRSQEARMAHLEQEMSSLHIEVRVLKNTMDSNTAALQEYIELSKSFKIGLKFLGLLEKTAVWITKMAAAGGLVWGLWKFAIKEAIAEYARRG